jgi:Leucine-rich repeat (LRR) protein
MTEIRASVAVELDGLELMQPLAQADAEIRRRLTRNAPGGGVVELLGGALRLTRLPSALGAGQGKELLTRLCMRGHTLVDVSRGQSLDGFDRLTSVDLRSNQMTTVPKGLLAISALRECNLGDNQIAKLPAIEPALLPALRSLWLDSNQLSELPGSLFGCASLSLLDVRANPLASLPVEALLLQTKPTQPGKPPPCAFLLDLPNYVPRAHAEDVPEPR